MKLTIFWLTARTAILVVAVTFGLVKLQAYLTRHGEMLIPASVYTILGIILIWVVLSLSMRGVLRELRARAKSNPLRPINEMVNTTDGSTDESVETVHGYPVTLKVLVAMAGFVFVALPYVSAAPGENISIGTYVICFSMACLIFAILIYILNYSVTVKHNGLAVHAFGSRIIAFSDMMYTKLIKTKNGQQLTVTLRNGKVLRFGSTLTGFQTLLYAVTKYAPLKMD